MMEDRLGRQLGGMVRESDPVPDPPTEEIWSGVVAARGQRKWRPARTWRPRLVWSVGMAATLVLGIAIGQSLGPAPDVPASETPQVSIGGPAQGPPPEYQQAAADYLARTEALLAVFPAGAREGGAPQVAAWARQLLLDTRLLLDSPAAVDPELAPLLSDLELVLAQMAALGSPHAPDEIELIEDGIQQNRVLARLRLAAGAAAGVNGDD